MTITRIRPSFTLTEDRLAELRAVIPEAFADGKLDWEAVRDILADNLDDESPDAEHFGLSWPGKRNARRLAAKPPQGSLHPAPGQGINEDTTHNIFIEGDNLEVVKLLQKSYAGRVKMIYIDPPYNTGNNFVYKDDFGEPLDSYLRQTGQVGDSGQALTTNTQSSGRFHSNWLNMMYPRLVLARQLLRDDGAIFITIDDTEVHHLRSILSEIFGEENFVANIVWQKRTSPDARATLGPAHDSILLYARNLECFKQTVHLLPISEERARSYTNPDNDPRGPWASVDLTGQTGHATASQFYDITTPSGVVYGPPAGRCWALAERSFKELVSDGRIWFGINGDARPRLKRYLSEVEGIAAWTWWTNQEVGHNQEAKQELNAILGVSDVFDTPKPVRLVTRMLQLVTNPHGRELVIDFFAGSSTTAEAVLAMNRQDYGGRRFIMVQLPEVTPDKSPARKAGFDTIAEIGKERIRRVIHKLALEAASTLDLQNRDSPEDLGFKVFTLGRSNFTPWQDYQGDDLRQLQSAFDTQESPLVPEWTPADLLTEILLIEGFPLDSQVVELDDALGNTVQRVTSDGVAHSLFVCLDEQLAPPTI